MSHNVQQSPPSKDAYANRPLTSEMHSYVDELKRNFAHLPTPAIGVHARIKDVCERVRGTLNADLVSLIEPYHAAGRRDWARFLLAAGTSSEAYEGIFSKCFKSRDSVPHVLQAKGFATGLTAPIDNENEPDCRLIGAFWQTRENRPANAETFLDAAAGLLHAEVRQHEVDHLRSLLAERLYQEQRANAEAAAATEERIQAESLSQARDRIRQSEELYRGIVNLATEGIWRTDAAGNSTLVNGRVADMLRVCPAQLQLASIHEFVGSACKEEFATRWSLLMGGLNQKFDCCFRVKGRSYFWAQVSATPMRSANGEVDGALLLLTDISARRQAENYLLKAKLDADSANEAKSRFLANMSHEIRTPLGAVLGFAELLLDADQNEQQRLDCVNAIRRNGRLLLDLINDILDLSKVEAGRLDVETKPLSLLDLVIDLRTLFKPQAQKRNLCYEIEISPDLPRWISTDPTRLRQILINLIGNAMKFTEHGTVKVQLLREADQLVCHVSDSGVGISEAAAKRLFTPFTQADPSVNRQFGGTGLGLVLARNLARALGGDVRLLKSIPGLGSVFECRIRLQRVSEIPASSPRHPQTNLIADRRLLEHLEVLVADDCEDNRLLLSRILKKFSASVTLVQNGKEAVQAAMAGHFDVVLMDIQMPTMDGYEATRALRESGYRKPIIALTAHALKEERELILKAGCDQHVTKPVDRDILLKAILEVVRR